MPKEQKRKTRANGTGTAIKIGNNNWKVIVTIDSMGGKLRRRCKQGFSTKTEALAYAPQLLKDSLEKCPPVVAAKHGIEKRMTFKAAFDAFMASHETDISKTLAVNYRNAMKVFAPIENYDLASIGIDDLQYCIDNARCGKSIPKFAKVAAGLMYKWAVPRGYVPGNINYAQYIKLKPTEDPAKTGIPLPVLKKIGKLAETDVTARIVYCHCYLGFRPGELLALRIGDLYAKDRYFIGGSKTEAGKNRMVTISPKIWPYVEWFAGNAIDGPYIFSVANGKKLSDKIYRERFYALLDRLGVSYRDKDGNRTITPHSCRHTFATLVKGLHAPAADVLKLMGHTDVSMTVYYQDTSLEDLRKITDEI